jgi:hypothetical protein
MPSIVALRVRNPDYRISVAAGVDRGPLKILSRRRYRNVNDTKSGKRREMTGWLSFNTDCELGFHGSLDEWQRLMGAVARR